MGLDLVGVDPCPVATKIPRPMRLTWEKESSLTTRDGNGVRFAGSSDGQVAARDNEDCPPWSPASGSCTPAGCRNARVDGG
jgi:hypothetical protein